MRLFVAVDLSDDARDAIAEEQARIATALGQKASIKWVKPGAAHLTLVFLGSVDAARAATLVEAIGADVDLAPFDMVLEGAGAFPPRGAPRVLWIGTSAGAAELVELQQRLSSRISGLGIALETRPFHPHLTIGRWRESRPSDRERALAAARPGAIARVRVESATLYESKLPPSGPSYTALTRANLTRRLSCPPSGGP
jgi:RNA 2',3'-cyclic 3'-phosphodiesterase